MNMSENLSEVANDYHQIKQMILNSPFNQQIGSSQVYQKNIDILKHNKKQILNFPVNNSSYLLSNNSKSISELVSHIPVLDMLTCNNLMPEAQNHIRRSKSLSNLLNKDKNNQEFNFSSSTLSEICPNILSYADLTKFMVSPQHYSRLCGQILNFEKMMIQFKHIKQFKKCNKIDLTDFFRRDEELIEKRKLANPPTQKNPKYANKLSIKVEQNAEKQKASKCSYPFNVKRIRHEITEIENKNRKKEIFNEDNIFIRHINSNGIEKAKRAEAHHNENNFEESNNVITTLKKEKKRKFNRKMPSYMSEITSFKEEQRNKEAKEFERQRINKTKKNV